MPRKQAVFCTLSVIEVITDDAIRIRKRLSWEPLTRVETDSWFSVDWMLVDQPADAFYFDNSSSTFTLLSNRVHP